MYFTQDSVFIKKLYKKENFNILVKICSIFNPLLRDSIHYTIRLTNVIPVARGLMPIKV